MNTPSPLIPQGSLLEQKNNSHARVKVAFFCVVGVHVAAILAALLAQGCKRDPTVEPGQPVTQQPAVPEITNSLPTFEPTNAIVESAVSNPVAPLPQDPAPLPPVAQVQEHEVQKGDSFSSIAPKYHVTVKAIQAANPTVNPAKLQIGQKLVIPPATTVALNGQSGGAAPAPGGGEQTYVVKAGDNLTKIAAQFGTTIGALRRANSLTTDKIKAGDKLKIPATTATPAPR